MIILTEKPSVALEFAKALNCKKENGYYTGNNICIVNAVGHLLELYEPHDYNISYKKWDINTLPIIPGKMLYKPITSTKTQLDIIKKCFALYGDILLLATDAEREGELIGATILKHVGFTHYDTAKRFWVSEALTPEVIHKGIQNAKPLSSYTKYKNEGYARQHADWLTGINITRFLSVKANTLLTFGRVQTAVLYAIYKREQEIASFQKEKYYQLEVIFLKGNGSFKGYYTSDELNRFSSKEQLEKIQKEIGSSGKILMIESKRKTILPPQLYNLTGLQKDAAQFYNYSPEQTLEIAQTLYEKHKCLSYPRTPSKVMGDDNVEFFIEIYNNLKKIYSDYASETSLNNMESNKSRIFDNESLVDHHALIPLKPLPPSTSPEEGKIYLLVLNRFFFQFKKAFIFDAVKTIIEANNHIFVSTGKKILQKGWKTNEEEDDEKEQQLPELNENEIVNIKEAIILEKYTEPKKHYTDTSLLQLMENPTNEEGKKITGLGTPATRASIISSLLKRDYIYKSKKNIGITDKGKFIITTCLKDSNLTDFMSIETTTLWEQKLSDNPIDFLETIKQFLSNCIKTTSLKLEKYKESSLGYCPVCKKEIQKGEKNYYCSGYKEGCTFSIWKSICGTKLSDTDISKLLDGKTTGIKKMKNKDGKEFQARITLDNNKISFVFAKN